MDSIDIIKIMWLNMNDPLIRGHILLDLDMDDPRIREHVLFNYLMNNIYICFRDLCSYRGNVVKHTVPNTYEMTIILDCGDVL